MHCLTLGAGGRYNDGGQILKQNTPMETTENLSPKRPSLRELLQAFSWLQRGVLFFGLLALISPLLPWFHSCFRAPGIYTCTTWNGFQWDNDIYGTIIFLLGFASLAVQLAPLVTDDDTLRPVVIQNLAGALLLVLAIVRVVSFHGESTPAVSIGPNIGLLVVFIAGIGLLILNQFHELQQLIAKMSTLRDKIPTPPSPVSQEDELQTLLDDTTDDNLDKAIHQEEMDLQ